jgi:hypothetical protein
MSEISAGKGSMSLSLVASLVAHAALLLAMAVPSVRDRLIRPLDSGEAAPSQAQTWAGTTAELPSGETLYDVQLTGSQGVGVVPEPPGPPAAPQAPPEGPPPAPPPPPAETSPREPPSPKPEEPARPAPKPESPVAPKPEPKARPKPPEEDDPYADVSPPPKPAKEPVAVKRIRDPEDPSREDPEETPPAKKPNSKAPAKPAAPKAPAVAANANPKPASPGGNDASEPAEDPAQNQNQNPKSGLGGTGPSGGSFGAVGRAGVRDLGAAFTQAIPAACGADMTWSEIELGDGGTVRIAIDIDENGRLKSFTPLEKNPPKQLRNLAKRTFDLLQSGTFALRGGAVTAGRQTVEVSASVSMTDKPATTGGLIELSHGFENGLGRAHFVQSTGREVRFRVRVIRIEVTAAPTGE